MKKKTMFMQQPDESDCQRMNRGLWERQPAVFSPHLSYWKPAQHFTFNHISQQGAWHVYWANQKMNAKPSPAQQNNVLLITINETTAVNAKNKTQSDFCFRSARFPSGEDHYSVRRGNAPEPRLPTNLPQEYCVGLETSGDQQYEDPAHLRWAVWSGGPRRWHMQVRICLTIAMVTYWLIATVILKFLS